MSLYETLGVAPDASTEEVLRAYRKAAQKSHPDRKGGSSEKFQAVQKAYEVLSDPARRANYAASGDTSEPMEALEQRAMKEIAHALIQAVEQCPDLDHMHIVQDVREAVGRSIAGHREGLRQLEMRIERHRKAIKRMKRKKPGPNLMAQMIEANISGLQRGMAMGRDKVELGEKMLAILADYDYEIQGGLAGMSPTAALMGRSLRGR